MKSTISAAVVFCGLTFGAQATEIPLSLETGAWQALTYTSVQSNVVKNTGDSMNIHIMGSASPLIYVFDQPQIIQSILASGSLSGVPTLPKHAEQGDEGADDFALRIGLVLAGDKQLGPAQQLFAPKWIKTVYGLAPENTGIDHILFLNVAQSLQTGWQQRTHPNSEGLFVEHKVAEAMGAGTFLIDHTFDQTKQVIALWISADGDDTQSSFDVTIDSISYQ